jgi:hypothetical protein
MVAASSSDLNISGITLTIPDDSEVDRVELAGGETYQRLRVFQGDFQVLVSRALTQATLHAVQSNVTMETALQYQEKAIRNALDGALHAALLREDLLSR